LVDQAGWHLSTGLVVPPNITIMALPPKCPELNPVENMAAPHVPTVDEAGLPGLQITSWHGLWVPKDTSRDIIAKLNEAVVEALADPTVRRRLADLANETVPREQQTPAALASWQKAEIEKWWPIIKAAGVKAE
jgi:tripartite-type tricarboxylate transporter receptor subunit TctC